MSKKNMVKLTVSKINMAKLTILWLFDQMWYLVKTNISSRNWHGYNQMKHATTKFWIKKK